MSENELGVKQVFDLLIKRLESYENNQKKINTTIASMKDFITKTSDVLSLVEVLKKEVNQLKESKASPERIKGLEESIAELETWQDKITNVVNLSDLKEIKSTIKSQAKDIALLQQAMKTIKAEIKRDTKNGSAVTGGGIGAIAGAAGAVLLEYIRKQYGG